MKTTIAAAILATAFGASFAAAQDIAATRPMPPFDQLAADKLAATLEHRGISGITSIQTAAGGYVVTAMKDTRPVTVWVDPQSGDIEPVRNR